MLKINKNLFFMQVQAYFDTLRSELKSEQTINSYRDALNDFRMFLKQKYNKNVDKITFDIINADLVREYLSWIIEQGNSVNTRNLRLTAIKCYVKFCADNNIELLTLVLVLSKIKTKKVHPKTHNWLSKEQINLVLKQPTNSKIGIRDRFILMFLFSTGVRLNELINIKLKDIASDIKEPFVKVVGKGNKPRIIPLPNDLIDNLNYYKTIYHEESSKDDYLFYTIIKCNKDKMSEDNIQRIAKKYGDMARIIDSSIPTVHPHLFRNTNLNKIQTFINKAL